MARTPDRSPGAMIEDEEIRFLSNSNGPTVPGAFNYDGTEFVMRDAMGTFNPRSSASAFTISGPLIETAFTASFPAGLSGSLTRLTDGTPFLIAGSGVTIATASNGSVSISSFGGGGQPGGSPGQVQYNNAGTMGGISSLTWNGSSLSATGSFLGDLAGTASYAAGAGSALTSSYAESALSASFATNSLTSSYAENASVASYTLSALSSSYSSTSLSSSYASNADLLDGINSTDFARLSQANTFTGSQVITGTVTATLGFSGSLTSLASGAAYLAQGLDILITTGSTGQVTIAATRSIPTITTGTAAPSGGSNGDIYLQFT